MPPCSSYLLCPREGTLQCTRCKGAESPTVYCSQECQKTDWVLHKQYCGKLAYVFSIELMGSSNPTITRRVAVPSWFTFQQFHFTLQYVFGPWQNCHEHTFAFVPNPRTGARFSFEPLPENLLKIVQPGHGEKGRNERKVKLADVYDLNGELRSTVTRNGVVVPLIYEYDFGDGWEHKITFEGSELARGARPLVKHAVGCGPVDGCGGILGWNAIKEAFSATNPTPEQQTRISWAKPCSGWGDDYDPLAPVNVMPMNYEGRWENHYRSYMANRRYSRRVYP